MELPLELDLRGLARERRRTLALHALNDLRPGQALVFVTDCLPRDLVSDLGGEARGDFDFAALEQTEDAHTLEVRRHAPERDLIDIIASEHHRIDRLLTEVEWRLSQRLFQEAGQRFGQLRVALQYHMLMEDQLLFPAYDRSHGSASAILTLRREHDIMRTLLAQVGLGLRKESEESRSAVRALADLRELFGPHARREETELAPVLESGEASRLRHQLDELRAV